MKFLSAMKDRMISTFVRMAVSRSPLKDLGDMTSCRIDTENKQIFLTLELLGEERPIEGALKYRIDDTAPERQLVIEDAEFSREWITRAFQAWARDKVKIPIPENAAPLLDLLKV